MCDVLPAHQDRSSVQPPPPIGVGLETKGGERGSVFQAREILLQGAARDLLTRLMDEVCQVGGGCREGSADLGITRRCAEAAGERS